MLDALRELITLNSFVILFMALAGISLFVGVLMVLSPSGFQAIAARMNRGVSARRALKTWEIPRATEPFFYRHHRVFGVLIILGVALYLVRMWGIDQQALIGRLSGVMPASVGSWLIPILLDTFTGLNVVILLVGLIVLFRPSMLKGLEEWGNRWISTRQMGRRLEERQESIERLAQKAPRLLGALIILGSLYILANLALLKNI